MPSKARRLKEMSGTFKCKIIILKFYNETENQTRVVFYKSSVLWPYHSQLNIYFSNIYNELGNQYQGP